MTIGMRIKSLRKEVLKLTQAKFGEKIGLKSTAIGQMESGDRNVTDRTILLICNKFNVNEEWLREGKGEMFIEPDTFSLDEYLKQRKVSDIEADIVKAYFDIPFEERQHLIDAFKTSLMKGYIKSNDEKACTIDEELEAYRKELEAEQKGTTSLVLEKPKENLG